ncbi:General stress protein 69 [Chryseobacterium taihuense]|uniref:General stress protein 69 n=1 Tax=Chryseobacterium taihuense TaxID=1141221 RepID=A0A4U8WF28_9FLAO|nr:aldo/keto reductase [Chryseobacterium sp. FDAARGOS 1104]VFB03565.1 General stress protein 69 [Chryseobacterium taihuense]
MKKVKLGNQGLIVPNIGLGCMGMTGFGEADMYGKSDEQEAIATIHRSLELGGNFLDTADLYGPFKNEQLIAKAIEGNRDQYIIATKFGWEIDDNEQVTWKINGSKDYVKKSVERSLKNLKTDYIDLYYMHRLDKNVPIEETVGAMSDLVKEGKIGYIGLSEVGSETVKRAHAVHPISAVQSEYSLFERTVEEKGIIKTLNELGIGFVAYSPLGRGFLSGNIKPLTICRKMISEEVSRVFRKSIFIKILNWWKRSKIWRKKKISHLHSWLWRGLSAKELFRFRERNAENILNRILKRQISN